MRNQSSKSVKRILCIISAIEKNYCKISKLFSINLFRNLVRKELIINFISRLQSIIGRLKNCDVKKQIRLNSGYVRYMDIFEQKNFKFEYWIWGSQQLIIQWNQSKIVQNKSNKLQYGKNRSPQTSYLKLYPVKKESYSVILQKCQNIFDLNQGNQAKNLASEIDDLYQQASQIELHQIEYFESSQQVQGVAKFNLGDLIHHSVTIEGCKLIQILKNKQETAQKNGLDPLMTYIRLGLGHFNKDSAGHQFVLEIWPFKHYSSIHDYAGQYGIVKVLQEIINVKIYAILSNAKHLMNPIKSLTCNQNDMTWLSPKLNQVHQLSNIYPQTAITLQCYKYSKKSQEKIKQFAYVANQQYKNFNPLSDFPDIELHTIFKELVEEYSNLYKKNDYFNYLIYIQQNKFILRWKSSF
ncbi:unnamed protein product [Paramecium pentaurelia]|uniref:Uncharacterized protein n=1 Tax=Paramecium pentaurelia TaxID=43138 RepID=A0A8S1T244_9CILI|nr:unnamed protein product [Paramecium pentaurelia]